MYSKYITNIERILAGKQTFILWRKRPVMALMGNFYLIEPDSRLFSSNGDVLKAKRRASEYLSINRSYRNIENHIEEFVRQWTLKQIISQNILKNIEIVRLFAN
ncbi:MAG: hypothetical protein LBG43_00445 [Treponema sp.]|nr:hypothetical protein [Treponema sp.]